MLAAQGAASARDHPASPILPVSVDARREERRSCLRAGRGAQRAKQLAAGGDEHAVLDMVDGAAVGDA